MLGRTRTHGALALLAVLLLAGPVCWAEDECDVQTASRVVAVGDVHGGYDNLVAVLQMVGLVDEEARWVGGKAHLVQTGDLLDRGPQERQVLDLVMRLEKEAKKAGGRVHALLGNHEVMNMLGDRRYVAPQGYAAFVDPSSERHRRRLFDHLVDEARDGARSRDEEFDEDAYRAKLDKEVPLGLVERVRAFSDDGNYGRWLRERNVVARINGVAFLHGGLTLPVAELGCEEINKTVRKQITRELEKTRENVLATLAAGPEGPLWYRGLAREDEVAFAPTLVKILAAMDIQTIVVGHTVTVDGRIHTRFGGRVIMIDVGMSPVYQGARGALEIDGDGVMTAVYPEEREVLERGPLPAPAAAATLARPVPLLMAAPVN